MLSPAASSQAESPTTLPAKPDRPKTMTACYNCRQRKLRCDGSNPSCSNCLLYKTDCSYAQGRNKSGPPKGSKRKPRADADQDRSTKKSRRSSSSTLVQFSHPGTSSPSDLSSNSTRSASPIENSGDVIPSLIGPLSAEWFTEWGIAWTDQPVQPSDGTDGTHHDFTGTWSFPCPDPNTSMDPDQILMPNLLSEPNAVFLSAATPSSDISPIASGSSSITYCNPPGHQSPISHDLLSSTNVLAPGLLQIDDCHSIPYSFEIQQQPQSPALDAFRFIHAFVPVFPFRELAQIIENCEAHKDRNIHSAFFLSAFQSLSAVVSARSSAPNPQHHLGCYATAQQQSMQAYFATITQDSSISSQDITYTAAGLIYLATRAVFTSGWCKETSTWLRLAVDVIERIPRNTPRDLGLRCWLARIVWLWDKALTGCEPDLPSVTLLASGSQFSGMQNESSLDALEFDEEQQSFSDFFNLCVDLEGIITQSTEGSQTLNCSVVSPDLGQYSSLANHPALPLCQRVQTWVKSNPTAHDFILQFGVEPQSDDEVRESVGRVLHLVYYGMIIKFNHIDRVQCGLKKTSLTVAVARLVDAADWLVTTRRLWLWPLAERALLLTMDYLLDQSGIMERTTQQPAMQRYVAQNTHNPYWTLPSLPATATEIPAKAPFQQLPLDVRMLLSLVKDVFAEAHSVLDPCTASTQRAAAAKAVESISTALRRQENSKLTELAS